MSLWESCHDAATYDPTLNLSEAYNGVDELMRQVMRVAEEFERWACDHVCFDSLGDVWPYLLEDRFGKACLEILEPIALARFDRADCLRVALRMRLPIALAPDLPVPIDVRVASPLANSGFREFRIQTVRDRIEEDDTEPFVASNDPFDADFGLSYYSVYGVGEDGSLQHIANRRSYEEAANLLRMLVPGIALPIKPTSCSEPQP